MRAKDGEDERGDAATKSSRRAQLCALAVALVVSELLYLVLLRLDAVNGVRPVLVFLALMGGLFALYAAAYLLVSGLRGNERGVLFIIGAGALLFRLTLLPAGLPHDASPLVAPELLRADVRGEAVVYERFLLFDGDAWRYLWDGHVAAHGVNPYAFAPADAALDAFADEENDALSDGRAATWSDIRDNVNHPSTPTIYPPFAQGVFRFSHWLAPGSMLVLKGLLVGFDLLACLFLALALRAVGRPVTTVILYAWNPLVVKVFAASGHADAMLVAALAATAYFIARRAPRAAAVAFALAILAKLSPVVLLPFVARRVGWRNTALAIALVGAAYLPFLDAGGATFDGFLTFARGWQFNAGVYSLVKWAGGLFLDASLASVVARASSMLAVVAVVGMLTLYDDGRDETFARYAVVALGAIIVFSPTVMPWYVTWMLPLAVVANRRVWVYFSAIVCTAFLIMINGAEFAAALWLEHGLLALLIYREYWRGKRQPQRATHALVNGRMIYGNL